MLAFWGEMPLRREHELREKFLPALLVPFAWDYGACLSRGARKT